MSKFQNGWFTPATIYHSPNFSPRPGNEEVSLIVLHNISLPPFEYGSHNIHDFFQNNLDIHAHPFFTSIAHLQVSSHFVIERNGHLSQFVSCNDKAYHAGVSHFAGRDQCNDFSIGIELEGCDFEPFSEAQYTTLLPLLNALCAHYPVHAICGHSDIAPQRKTDPGYFFDWHRLQDFPVQR